jgi:Arc/MetJ family transcription regulator
VHPSGSGVVSLKTVTVTDELIVGTIRRLDPEGQVAEGGTDDALRSRVHRLLALSVRREIIRSGFGEMIGLSGIQYTILIPVAHLNENNGISVKRMPPR